MQILLWTWCKNSIQNIRINFSNRKTLKRFRNFEYYDFRSNCNKSVKTSFLSNLIFESKNTPYHENNFFPYRILRREKLTAKIRCVYCAIVWECFETLRSERLRSACVAQAEFSRAENFTFAFSSVWAKYRNNSLLPFHRLKVNYKIWTFSWVFYIQVL